jgi:3-oxoacyl-[acyl-carrier-protein] synthase-1
MEGLKEIYINAVSMVTPVGPNSAMTMAAVRAARSAYTQSPILGRDFNPLKIAPIPVADDLLWAPEISNDNWLYKQRRPRRMLGLSAAALAQILPSCPATPLPLFLAGPESIPVSAIDGSFPKLLADVAPDRIDTSSSRLIATGRPGGIQAVELAFRYLSQSAASDVLIGGVDSLIDLPILGAWSNEERITSINVGDGFTPGEAASFLLLSTSPNQRTLAKLHPPGVAEESGHRYSSTPYLGNGLAKAFTEALQGFRGPLIDTIWSSMNGESYGVKEHGVSLIRNQRSLCPSFKVEHPADCFGDLGAAIGPTLLGLAAANLYSKKTQRAAIVCCSAELETRAACVVSAIN